MSAIAKARDFVGCALRLGDGPLAKCAILWHESKNVRARLGLARYHPTAVYSVATVHGRLWFRDNFGDITNLPNLMYRQAYLIPRPLGDGAILDVGANIGLAAAWFASRYPGRPVHCFEPLTANTRLIALNCPGAVVNAVAVGAAPGTIELSVDEDSVMASSIATRWDTHPRRVPVIRLDDYVTGRDIDRVALLKIDTEGMELDVLNGASETLARTEQVAMETHGDVRHSAVLDRLREAGFHIDRDEFAGATGMVFASRTHEGAGAERQASVSA
ncbi:MAG TPA: FkbM family methyltransferase [Gemmatimonadaceae bacterium]|nr:FkbM family methyltransferase [Gemmatimonadaceae bacterium]